MSDRIVKEKTGGEKKKRMDGKEAQELRRRINAHAKKVVTERFLEASIPDHSPRFPNFSTRDVVRGQYLGKGKFGMVYEVLSLDGGASRLTSSNPKWFQRPTKNFPTTTKAFGHGMESQDDDEIYDLDSSSDADKQDEDSSLDGTTYEPREREGLAMQARLRKKQEDARTFMRQHCRREENGKPRYAIKVLSPEVLDEPTTLYYQGIMDMASETRLLSTIRHPHVIKLRGVGNDPCTENFFLILDRLYQTLEQRWKHWQKLHRRHSCLWGLADRRGRLRAAQYQERMVCAHDLASGLAYLHSKKIIHRDIKSDNIGFDVRGDIKIFDFGLSRELPPQDKATPDGTWKMTGSTGTPRYMSPEVALEQSYNEACDTYSFCILLWEMMSLDTAFEHYTWISFRERVWKEPHKRPFLHPSVWSEEMQVMLQQGWNGDLKQRMPMTEIVETLRQEVIRRGGFDDEWGLVFERRSTHIFDEGDAQYLQGGHDSFLSMFASPLRSVRLSMIGSRTSPKSAQSAKSSKVDVTAATQTIDPSELNSPRLMASNPSLFLLELPLKSLEGDDTMSSQDEEEVIRGRDAAKASHAAIFEQVKAETVRRKRESILGKAAMAIQDDDFDDRAVHANDAFSILNQSSPSMIYQEVKDETVRRERERILGNKRTSHKTRSERLLRAVRVVQKRKDSRGGADRPSSGIWDRIEEEHVRQTELRSRLSLNRDVQQ